MEVVMKYTMYGFYPDKVPFVKLYLRNPQDINKVVAILEDGALGRVYQPFESHVPFLLQFTTDNNITPMGWMHLSQAMHRVGDILEQREEVDQDRGEEEEIDQEGEVRPENEGNVDLTFRIETAGESDVVLVPERNRQEDVFSEESKICDEIRQARDREVEITMEGITADMIFTQGVQTIQRQYAMPLNQCIPQEKRQNNEPRNQNTKSSNSNQGNSTNDNNATNYNHKKTNFKRVKNKCLEKVSVSEIEIDVHVGFILNVSIPRSSFGSELWDEQRTRREAKGLPQEIVLSQPATQTMHRVPGLQEIEFRQRVDNLMAKGQALADTGCYLFRDTPRSNSNGIQRVIEGGMNAGGGGEDIEDEGGVGDDDINEWAVNTQQNEIMRNSQEEHFSQDLIAEQYVNTQVQFFFFYYSNFIG
jgi:DNA polymerase zeta